MNYTLEQLNEMMVRNGGSLYLGGTQITSLPEGLTVGGSLDLSGTQITNPDHYTRLKDGDYVQGKYIYADGILTHIKRARKMGAYTYYVGKIEGQNVVTDGEFYAHCEDFKSGVTDIEFKKARDRGAEQYRSLTLDSVVRYEDAVVMYRVITGACQAGTQQFIDGLREVKGEYTVQEIIDLTTGAYGGGTFKAFFEGDRDDH